MSHRFLLSSVSAICFLLCTVSSAHAQTGGPDAFGYNYAPTSYDFVDLSSGGTNLLLSDDGEANVPLPWPFSFYGVSYSDIVVASNGGIRFVAAPVPALPAQVSFVNGCLPGVGISDVDLAPFWDDLNPTNGGGVYWQHDTTGGANRFVVSWQGVPHYPSIGAASFQVHLYPGGEIQFHWEDTDFGDPASNFGASATIGIQDLIGGTRAAGNALQYTCNAAQTLDGTALSFASCVDADNDGVPSTACGGTDCDDGNASVYPGNIETCDGIDNDCDPSTDEAVDGDSDLETVCAGDCDDADPAINTGAVELCDGIDNDCNGLSDFDALGEVDADADGSLSCADCDDTQAASFPGNPEVCDGGIDNDCDPATTETVDFDGDGFTLCGVDGIAGTADDDCDDNNPNAFPSSTNVEVCDGSDNDCDGTTLGGGSGIPASLTTTFASGNGSSGNIFDVVVLNDIQITSFDAHVSGSGAGTMDVYWKVGTGYNSPAATPIGPSTKRFPSRATARQVRRPRCP